MSSGGTSIDTTVSSGGTQIISSGGMVDNIKQEVGGNINVIVESSNPTSIRGVNASGKPFHLISGIASNFILYSGGWQIVRSDGISYDTEINNGALQSIYDGGTTHNTIINNGGTQLVESGGSIIDTTINTGGSVIVRDGATVSGTLKNMGIADVGSFSGGTISNLARQGGLVDFNTKVATYNKNISIGNLSGSQTFEISADLRNNTADKMVVNNASGTHFIKVIREASQVEELLALKGNAPVVQITGIDGASFIGKKTNIEGVSIRPQITHNGNIWEITGYELGSTTLSKVALDVAKLDYSVLFTGENNLKRRLGDLSENNNNAGLWMKIQGGDLNVDHNSLKYVLAQGGYDKVTKVHNGTTITGVTLEYLKGSATYGVDGNGRISNTRLGAYHAWIGDSGHYYDIILKTGKMNNSVNVYDEGDITNSGYSVWNTGISAEYGYTKQLKYGYYITPQAELFLGKINGANYRTSDGTLIRQEGINSVIGRMGVTVGRKTENASVYLTGSLMHEFVAKAKTTTGVGVFSSTIDRDLKGTYFEFALGGSFKVGKGLIYLEGVKNLGGKVKQNWQMQVGYRFGF